MLKKKTFRNLTVLAATAAFVTAGYNVFAQDDLDDLLSDISATQTEAKKEEPKAAPVVEPQVVEAPVQEAAPVQAEAPKASEEVAAVESPAEAQEPVAATEPVEAKDEPKSDSQVAEATVGGLKPAENLSAGSKKVTDEQLLDALRKTQELRFKTHKIQAEREIQEAEKCMSSEDYQEAARHYALAKNLLGSAPTLAALRKKCDIGIAEGLYLAALQEDSTGRRDRALKLIEMAIERRHPKARRQHEAWVAEGDPKVHKADISEVSHRRNEDDYKAKRAEYNQHLKRAQQLLAVRDLDRARDEVELVLDSDPHNTEALRLLEKVHKKRRTIMSKEREVTREGMMADVDKAWRPNYATDVRNVEVVEDTTKTPKADNEDTASLEQSIITRMKAMRLPAISFKPPATLTDAIEFFRQASKDYDRPDIPLEQRGFNFYFKPSEPIQAAAAAEEPAADQGFGADASSSAAPVAGGAGPIIPIISASDISFYDALKLVCEAVNYKFTVKGPMITVMHKDACIEEMHTRSFPVLSSFMERMDTAQTDVQDLRNSGNAGFTLTARAPANNDGGENKEQDWKEFFRLMGVEWPEGSSIMYIRTLGKLRVKNTIENLAELENALNEMNMNPTLIEIETRFVEVCQDDLNSLGFEWILNSDYSLGLGRRLDKALGIKKGTFTAPTSGDSPNTPNTPDSIWGDPTPGGPGTNIKDPSVGSSTSTYANGNGASWIRDYDAGAKGSVGFNRTGGDTGYGTNNRYLSTLGNHINGEGYSTNDQFMRVNAFLGSADLSMILHMLSQRSDTDLLSAPKVLTRSAEQAVIKVVTLYRYPRDYDVQLQSSRSSGSDYGGGSQSAILAIVEPGEFETQEVGVILDVTPTLTDNGNLIDLQLNTQVIDEPTWKNYGMRIPFTGNSSLQNFEGIGGIFEGLASVLGSLGTGLSGTLQEAFAERAVASATTALDSLTTSTSENLTYYDAPMEQPFFHIRSIDSKVSVYPGATIVMGGLITEQRKAMDDKVPFLGDIPFIGRLFRSHSELSSKRNLLIFVTTRLVDAHGREVKIQPTSSTAPAADVKPAPER
ncbi:MAG: hypothetical protein J6Q84_00650 [Kiritimatiellae bacterium]|nr:hypothetical protein [Kiritimatiellia bacterium]